MWVSVQVATESFVSACGRAWQEQGDHYICIELNAEASGANECLVLPYK